MTPLAWILALGCVLCYTGQNLFNKLFSIHYEGDDSSVASVFSVIYGVIAAVGTLAANGFSFHPSLTTVLFGLSCGAVLFFFNLSLIGASRSGPYAFQSLMLVTGGILPSYLFSAIFLNDSFTVTQIIGIIVMLLSFVVFNCKGLHFEGVKKGYFFWAVLIAVTNGAYSILVDMQQRVAGTEERAEMIIILFGVCALISLIQLLIHQQGKLLQPFKMSGKTWIFAVASSVCATVAVNLMMTAISIVPAAVLFTVDNGGVLTTCSLSSALLFHDKIEKHMWIGIAIAIASLILLAV